jgi:hypothetical protein
VYCVFENSNRGGNKINVPGWIQEYGHSNSANPQSKINQFDQDDRILLIDELTDGARYKKNRGMGREEFNIKRKDERQKVTVRGKGKQIEHGCSRRTKIVHIARDSLEVQRYICGMSGLTAAAAVRWLNGGDFQLLPSPTNQFLDEKQQTILRQQPEVSVEDFEHDENENIEEDMDEDEMLPPLQEQLLEKIECMSDTFKSYVTVQEKILQKLSRNASITNSSMDLLRSSSSLRNDKKEDNGELMNVWAQL